MRRWRFLEVEWNRGVNVVAAAAAVLVRLLCLLNISKVSL